MPYFKISLFILFLVTISLFPKGISAGVIWSRPQQKQTSKEEPATDEPVNEQDPPLDLESTNTISRSTKSLSVLELPNLADMDSPDPLTNLLNQDDTFAIAFVNHETGEVLSRSTTSTTRTAQTTPASTPTYSSRYRYYGNHPPVEWDLEFGNGDLRWRGSSGGFRRPQFPY